MRKAALAALALGFVATSLPGLAEAHISKERTRVRGNTATATWNYQNGNVATFMSVVVTQNDIVENGQPRDEQFATVSILQSDVVTGNVLVAGVADLSAFDFTIGEQLSTAHLHAEGLFEDDSTLTFFPITIDLTWTATADPVRQHSHNVFREPGFITRTRFKGVFRDAAVSGSVSGNDTEFVFGPSESAQIQRNDSGTVIVQINKCRYH
jgi:hypothetical protein